MPAGILIWFATAKRRSGCETARGCEKSTHETLKMAVLAPMPNASERTATAVNPGLRRRTRNAWRISRMSTGSWTVNGAPPLATLAPDGLERFPVGGHRGDGLSALPRRQARRALGNDGLGDELVEIRAQHIPSRPRGAR